MYKRLIMIAILVGMVVLFPDSVMGKYKPLTTETVLTSNNSVDIVVKVTKIKRKGNTKKMTIKCYGDIPEYDGQRYCITLRKWDWKREKFRKGQKVMCWLYDCGTKDVSDDVIINVSHQRYVTLKTK